MIDGFRVFMPSFSVWETGRMATIKSQAKRSFSKWHFLPLFLKFNLMHYLQSQTFGWRALLWLVTSQYVVFSRRFAYNQCCSRSCLLTSISAMESRWPNEFFKWIASTHWQASLFQAIVRRPKSVDDEQDWCTCEESYHLLTQLSREVWLLTPEYLPYQNITEEIVWSPAVSLTSLC